MLFFAFFGFVNKAKERTKGGKWALFWGGFLIEPSQGKRGNSSAWSIYKNK